ncbi:TetR family transcriptional regulator [Streptomyces sp. NPDC047000]|uniref:TetR/AcrR family transcriptional regulator n=1 Tax=Streptomyces sp. NPDC047000 TaxID=3155474 RepID=UPI0033C723D8
MDAKTVRDAGAGPRRDASATREALLTAAHSRFIRLGYERTTLRDVANEAGVNVALVKRYFGSKEGLFKAALTANDRFLDADGGFPAGADRLAEVLARQFSADAWPEFGEHPVLMLLRDPHDTVLAGMRRSALEAFARRIAESAGPPATDTSDTADAPDTADAADAADAAERQLRSQLVVALGVGMAVLRSAVAVQPLSDAGPRELAPLLRSALRALLEEPGDGDRT